MPAAARACTARRADSRWAGAPPASSRTGVHLSPVPVSAARMRRCPVPGPLLMHPLSASRWSTRSASSGFESDHIHCRAVHQPPAPDGSPLALYEPPGVDCSGWAVSRQSTRRDAGPVLVSVQHFGNQLAHIPVWPARRCAAAVFIAKMAGYDPVKLSVRQSFRRAAHRLRAAGLVVAWAGSVAVVLATSQRDPRIPRSISSLRAG